MVLLAYSIKGECRVEISVSGVWILGIVALRSCIQTSLRYKKGELED